MNVEEFYTLAEFLRQNPPKNAVEGAYRSAISRYYYFVFLKLRDNIVKEDGREEIEELLASPQAYFGHIALRIYISEVGRRSIKDADLKSSIGLEDLRKATFEIANQLHTLHKHRKFADYTTDKEETIKYLTSQSELTKRDISNETLIRYLKNRVDDSKKLADTIKDNVNNIIFLLERLKEKDKLPDPKRDIIDKIRSKQAK